MGYYFKLKGQPEKTKIISRKQAYHGVSMGALSATGMPQFWEMFEPLAPGFLHISAPYCYRCDFKLEYPSCDMACARELEKVILDEGPETAATQTGGEAQEARPALEVAQEAEVGGGQDAAAVVVGKGRISFGLFPM